MKKYTLELIVFICGAAVMVLELVGSRVLSPYVGTSIFVWTSLIGIILGSLSFGYWLGGRVSDREPTLTTLAYIIAVAALLVAGIAFGKDIFLQRLVWLVHDIRITSVLSATVLFALPAILLGMVSPYTVKLKLHTLAHAGATVGNLYAISTVGSIVGTFLAGFWLVPQFGNTTILYVIAIMLGLTSLYAHVSTYLKMRAALVIVCLAGLLVHQTIVAARAAEGFVDTDTQYGRVFIYTAQAHDGRPARFMRVDENSDSAMYLDSDELVFAYAKFYDLAQHFTPHFKKTLLLGGAAYSYPKYFLQNYPQATMDVVEIDPKLTTLARTYFRLSDDQRLRIFHEDGRIYLNRTHERYDVIFGDAFKSFYSVPFQLTTREAVQRTYDILTDGGVVLVNLIGAREGERGKFVRAEYATFASVFEQTYLLWVASPDVTAIQNLILVAVKSSRPATLVSDNPVLSSYLRQHWTTPLPLDMPLLTDEHAPVDYYMLEML